MEIARTDIRRLVIAANSYDRAYEAVCKKIGIKANMLWLLYALDDDKPHTQKQICDDWLMPRTTINTLIKECVAAEYITLQPIPGKKELQICLTESGRAYAEQALHVIYGAEDTAMQMTMQGRSVESMLEFISTLESLVDNIKIAFDDLSRKLK